MLYAKELILYINDNKNRIIPFGNNYAIQVYGGDTVQAHIMMLDHTIAKIEGADSSFIKVYLCKEDSEDIAYGEGCVLKQNDSVLKVFDSFSEHKDIESLLIALLQLKK